MSKKKKQPNVMKVLETKEAWDEFYNDEDNAKLCGNPLLLAIKI